MCLKPFLQHMYSEALLPMLSTAIIIQHIYKRFLEGLERIGEDHKRAKCSEIQEITCLTIHVYLQKYLYITISRIHINRHYMLHFCSTERELLKDSPNIIDKYVCYVCKPFLSLWSCWYRISKLMRFWCLLVYQNMPNDNLYCILIVLFND